MKSFNNKVVTKLGASIWICISLSKIASNSEAPVLWWKGLPITLSEIENSNMRIFYIAHILG